MFDALGSVYIHPADWAVPRCLARLLVECHESEESSDADDVVGGIDGKGEGSNGDHGNNSRRRGK